MLAEFKCADATQGAGESLTATDVLVRKLERETGLYVLHLKVERTGSARIGKLGEFRFAAG